MAEVLRLGVLRHETPATAAAAPPASSALTEWRCGNCRARLLDYAVVGTATLQTRCGRCKHWNVLEVR